MDSESGRQEPIAASNGVDCTEFDTLVELLAKINHDDWVSMRRNEGWTHGPQRDDARKQHPCLVPFEQLSPQEKDWDRRMAMHSLQAILDLGYEIFPPKKTRRPSCAGSRT